jgi:RNA recognition motif-containing protein
MLLFVGNLNKLTTEKELQTLFLSFGAINKLKIMVDKITRRSRGYAYVDMTETTEAEKAIAKLNSSMFMNTVIIVGAASGRQVAEVNWV